MTDRPDPAPVFEKDVGVDKEGIVGARWWHKALVAEAESRASAEVPRRDLLIAMGAILGGCCLIRGTMGAVGGALEGMGSLVGSSAEATSLATRPALDMQRLYGWDFGARGVPLVFDGVVQGPFVRAQLDQLAAVMAPSPTGPNAKHHVGTLVASLGATPTATLPDPQDGLPRPDGAPFKRLSEVLVPIFTPSMAEAYRKGEAVARIAGARAGFALLVDLPGPEAVAFAAGAAAKFEPVLLLDNWPHPHGVVPSHRALAALAYYQPRFAATKEARSSTAGPVFVLDRGRLEPYAEQSDRFDNRYHAKMPRLDALATAGVRSLLYVVASPDALPEPADLNESLAAGAALPRFEARAVALSDFAKDLSDPERAIYAAGPTLSDDAFWVDYPFGSRASPEAPAPGSKATKDHRFVARPAPEAAPAAPSIMGHVPVIVTASGLILAAALDRQGSRNRFAGGWSG